MKTSARCGSGLTVLCLLSLFTALALAAPPLNRATSLYTHPAARMPLSVGPGRVTAFTPDEGTVVTFHGSSPPAVLKVAGQWTWNPQLTPQGVQAAQLDFARCRVVLWNLSTRKVGATLQGDFRETLGCGQGAMGIIFYSAFTADGRFFLAADQRGVRRWDARTGKQLNTRTGQWYSLHLSPDGQQVALLGEARRIELWTADLSRRRQALPPQPSTCLNFMATQLTWSGDSRRLAFSCEADVRVWNVQAGGLQVYPRAQRVPFSKAPLFSPDSRYLIVGAGQSGVETWQVGNRQPVARTGDVGVGRQVTDLVVTQNNLVLAALSDGSLLRLDLTRPDLVLAPVQVYRKTTTALWPSLTVNPEGTWFAMSDGRGQVKVVPLPLPDDWEQ